MTGRYYTWQLDLSAEALNHVALALEASVSGHRVRDPHWVVEVKNMANEARAMLQKPDEIDDGIDPLLR